MNQYAFGMDGVRKSMELPEDSRRVAGIGPKRCGLSAYNAWARSLLHDKNFLLTIRADDGRTLLETRVEYMHQAFQRLTDWSIGETGYDVSAAIGGPNGFYTNHRIKTLGDFAWLEGDRT